MMNLDVKMRGKRGGEKKSCNVSTIEMVVLFLEKKSK